MQRVRLSLTSCFVAWSVASVLLGSNVGITVIALLAIVYGGLAILLAWIVLRIISKQRKQQLRRPWLEPLGVLAVLVLIYLDVPFYTRFFLSKPLLDRYAQQIVKSAGPGQLPRNIGLFEIREAEVLPDGVVRLITTSCMFDDCGLVFSPRAQPPVVGEDSYNQFTASWWQWWRSW